MQKASQRNSTKDENFHHQTKIHAKPTSENARKIKNQTRCSHQKNENHERIKSNPIWAKPSYLRIQHLFDPQEHPKRLFFSRRKLLLKTKCFPLWHHNTRRRFFCCVEYYLRIGFLQSRQFLTKKKPKRTTKPPNKLSKTQYRKIL